MMDSPGRRLSHNDYTVACICSMGVELAAVEGMLDEIHENLPSSRGQNGYTLGRVGEHNIVVAVIPAISNNGAASVAMWLLNDFQSIRFGLLVGIGGGVPSEDDDIRLGDVVVSKPTATFGGVVQYDMGKVTAGGMLQQTGTLKPPPTVLMANIQRLQAQQIRSGSQILKHIAAMLEKYPNMRKNQYVYPDVEHDQLFETTYAHEGGTTCRNCDRTKVVERPSRQNKDPEIHYGTIGSGNAVIEDGTTRERLRRDLGVLCVEMEAAGLMDEFSCLVIRGICDYADSHKNMHWQQYAAATAAAYMKELLYVIPVQEIAEASKATEALHKTAIFSIPFPRDKDFVARKSIFSQIETGFHDGRPVALCGIGGIGKSQIAIEYAYRFRDQHPQCHVLWVCAANEMRFAQAYRDAADRVQLPGRENPRVDVCKLMCEWLNKTEDVPWLVILDNADNVANFLPIGDEAVAERATNSVFMARYVPTKLSRSQCLLITTRSRDIGEHLGHGQACVDVGPFSSQEAGNLLRAKVRILHQSYAPEVDILVETLGRIPLAITQAAAFINQSKISVAEYIEELAVDKQNFLTYLSKELQDPRREPGFPNSVFRTWKRSFDQIQADQPRAAEMLSLMAMLDGRNIPEDLVRREDERQIDFNTAIGTLEGYSMISKEVGGKTCVIHPLVQLSVQYNLEQSGQTAFYTRQALQLIAKRFPNGADENKVLCESLLPHAHTVLQHDMKLDATAHSRTLLLYNVGWFESRQGRYESAYRHLQTTYQICQKIYGDEDENTLNSLGLLAMVLQYQGKYEAAEEMNRRALEGHEKVLGVEHPGTLTIVNNLARVLRYQEKYEAAEEMNRRVLAGWEKVLGVEHPDTLTSVSNLALVLQYQGKYEAAKEMDRRVLAGREKVLGLDHPDTLASVGDLAGVLQDQGKYEMAEEMNRRALEGREKVLGLEHPDTLTSVDNLAEVLRYQGKYEVAEEMNRRALAGRDKVLGVEHPDTLASVNNLALVLQCQGKYEAAEEMNRRALTGREKVLGVERLPTLASVSHLALVLQYQGKYKAAEEMNRRALARYEKVLGVEHPVTLASVSNLASVLQDQGKYEAAEEMKRRALAGSEKILGLDHPDTLTSVGNLAGVLQDQGKYEAAEEMNRRALAGKEKVLGLDHPDTLASVGNLAGVLQDQGKYEAAEEMSRRVLAGREKVLGVEHPHTLTSVNNLAEVLEYQGKYEMAEEINRRGLERREKVLGVEHPSTLTSVSNLAVMLQHQGKYEAAEEMGRRALAGREKIFGIGHPSMLTSVGNLALILQYQGKYNAAEEMNRRALAGREKILGVEHPDTLTNVGNLASVLQYQGKYEAAEEMSRRVLAGREKVLGLDHPDTLTSVGNLAGVLQDQGKYEAAEEMSRRVLAWREKVLGVEHPSTLTIVHNLALVLQDQGKYEAAEEMSRRALEGREKVLGVEHPDTLTSVHCLAHLCSSQKRFEQALALYQRALSGYRQTLGSTHPTTLACARHYASLLQNRETDRR